MADCTAHIRSYVDHKDGQMESHFYSDLLFLRKSDSPLFWPFLWFCKNESHCEIPLMKNNLFFVLLVFFLH